jgi:hypothetical protein
VQPYFLVVQFEQDTVLVGDEFMSIGMNIQRLLNDFTLDDPDLLRRIRLGSIECALCATLLVGYDSSLDDDPESSFTYPDMPLDRAVGHVG